MLAYVRALTEKPEPDKKLTNDFYCGDVLFLFNHVYDACYNQLTDDERNLIEKRVFQIARYHHNIQRKGSERKPYFRQSLLAKSLSGNATNRLDVRRQECYGQGDVGILL